MTSVLASREEARLMRLRRLTGLRRTDVVLFYALHARKASKEASDTLLEGIFQYGGGGGGRGRKGGAVLYALSLTGMSMSLARYLFRFNDIWTAGWGLDLRYEATCQRRRSFVCLLSGGAFQRSSSGMSLTQSIAFCSFLLCTPKYLQSSAANCLFLTEFYDCFCY